MIRKVFKWFGIILGGLLGLLALALVVIALLGTAKFNRKYTVSVKAINVPTGGQAVERGRHLAAILICTKCHGENLGGQVEFTIPGMLTIPTPNLTSGAGGVGASYTTEDWARAVRHGVGKDGRPLFIMPAASYHPLGDEDLGALIAYLKSLPPVDNPLPERRLELIGRLMVGAGVLPPFAADVIDHTAPPPPAPAPGVTAAYGEYVSHTCHECHGDRLNGAAFGPPGEQIITPNLTPGGELSAWSEEEFIQTMRTGVTPAGRTLREDMPWKNYREMTDDELQALWMYLQSLPVVERGE